jgi:hypothetical protein
VVRDKDLLKYLLGMVLVVFGYMAAWTVTNLNFIQENYNVLTVGTTYEGLQFVACKALWWDYVTETGRKEPTLISRCMCDCARNSLVLWNRTNKPQDRILRQLFSLKIRFNIILPSKNDASHGVF